MMTRWVFLLMLMLSISACDVAKQEENTVNNVVDDARGTVEGAADDLKSTVESGVNNFVGEVEDKVNTVANDAQASVERAINDARIRIESSIQGAISDAGKLVQTTAQNAVNEANRLIAQGVSLVRQNVSPDVLRLFDNSVTLASQGLDFAADALEAAGRAAGGTSNPQEWITLANRANTLANNASRVASDATGLVLGTVVDNVAPLAADVFGADVVNVTILAVNVAWEASQVAQEAATLATSYALAVAQNPNNVSQETINAARATIQVARNSIQVADNAITGAEALLGPDTLRAMREAVNLARLSVDLSESGVNTAQEVVNGTISLNNLAVPGGCSGRHIRVNTPDLNVRGGPSVNYGILTQIHSSECYPLLEENSGWIRIRTSGGEGWVNGQFVVIQN